MQEENYIIFVVVVSCVLVLLMVLAVGDLLLLARNRKLRYRNEILEMNSKFSQEIQNTRIEAIEQVFNDLAAELHDNIGQTLTLSVMHMNRMTQDESLRHHPSLNETRDVLRQAIQDVRELSQSLSSDHWRNFDLYTSLIRIRDRMQKAADTVPNFQIQEGITLKNKDHEVVILRVLQELINNSLKHSSASSINLKVESNINNLYISYADDGKGFIQETQTGNGMGLQLIPNRLKILNADWKIKTAPGEGFEIVINIPLQHGSE